MPNYYLPFIAALELAHVAIDETYGEGFAVANQIIWAAMATSLIAEDDAEKLRDTIIQGVADLERAIITHD